MRNLAVCVALATFVMLAIPPEASAHGGGSFRGPGGVVPPGFRGTADPEPPPPPSSCFCASHACNDCTTDVQRKRSDLTLATREVREVGRVGDVRELEVTIRLRGNQGKKPLEAVIPCDLGALCWVTGASMSKGTLRLTANPKKRETAVKRYRRTIARLIDPLIVLRSGMGQLDVRAWPVTEDADTLVRLRVYAFANEPSKRTRVYRSAAHSLAVIPKAEFEALDLEKIDTKGWTIHVDKQNGRAFVLLPWEPGKPGHHKVFPAAPVHAVRKLDWLTRDLDGSGKSAFLALEPSPQHRGRGPVDGVPPGPRVPSDPPPPPDQQTPATPQTPDATEVISSR